MFSVTYHGNFLPGSTAETQSTEADAIYAAGGTYYLTITGDNVGIKPVDSSYNSSVTFTLEPLLKESTTTVQYNRFFGVGLTTTSSINSKPALAGDLASVVGFNDIEWTSFNSVTSVSTLAISQDVSTSGESSPIVFSTFSNLPGAWRIPANQGIVYTITATVLENLTQATTSIRAPVKNNVGYKYLSATSTTVTSAFGYNFSRSYTASTTNDYSINTNTSEYSTFTGTYNAYNLPVAFTKIYIATVSNLYDYSISTIGIDTAGTFVNSSSSRKSATREYNYIFTRLPAQFTDPTTTYTTTSVFISSVGTRLGLMNSFNATVESSDKYTRVLSMADAGVYYNITVSLTTQTVSSTFYRTSIGSTSVYTYRFSNFNPMYEIESTTYGEKSSTITETSIAATISRISSSDSTIGINIHISESEIGKTYNDWEYSYTESTSIISSTVSTLTSSTDVVTELISGSTSLVTQTNTWKSHYTSSVKYSAKYYETVTTVSSRLLGIVSDSWKDTFTTSELRSSSIYRNSNSATIYSTINLSYTLTDDRIDYSTTYSSRSATSEVFSNYDIYSTYSNYEMAQTVDINGNYTYKTTYFGTLELGILDTTMASASSWLNIAAAQTNSYSVSSIDYSGRYFNTYYYGSTSSFGISGYNLTHISISSSYQENFNNPLLINTTELESSSASYSSLKKGVINTSFYTNRISRTTYTKFTLKDYATSFWVGYSSISTILNGAFINSYTDTNFNSYSSTAYNTSDYGSTARLSSLVSSKNWVNMFNTYLADNYAYTYNVSSVWNCDNSITETLSEYSTALATSFKKTYSTRTNYDSYSYTKSSRTNVLTTEDRFINRNGITNYSTVNVNVTNTVAVYNGSTMATMNSITSSNANNTSRSISVIDYTFISDINDFTSSDSVADTFTTSNVREQFNNSISTVVSSTMEQQNDTLVFKSEIVTFSTYNTSATYSTISTLEINYEATTYTEEYNPISYTVSSTIQSTSLTAGTILRSTSESVIHTQSVEYTPIYTTVDGIYMTTN